ncbi:hypothetical protein JCM15519_33340 [Fundidesulfovibrio butyratiphilus]
MNPEEAPLRLIAHKALYARVQDAHQRRDEALRETLGALRPGLSPDELQSLAAKIPPLMPELHRVWIALFVDRLFETASREQLATLCDNSPNNNAALALAYAMFLESERMEARMRQDFAALGISPEDAQDLAAVGAALCAGDLRKMGGGKARG